MNQTTKTSAQDADSVEKAISDIRKVLSVLSEYELNNSYYSQFSNCLFTDICHSNGVSERRIRKISGIKKNIVKIEQVEYEEE